MKFITFCKPISIEFLTFYKGYSLGFPLNSLHVVKGAPWDFNGIPYVLQWEPLRISMKFLTICNGNALRFL